MAEKPSIGQVGGKLSRRTRVVWATWLIGWIVMVASGVLALILKEGNDVPVAVWVAMGVGFSLAAIGGLAGDGTAGGSGSDDGPSGSGLRTASAQPALKVDCPH